jgi:hypothetical protein
MSAPYRIWLCVISFAVLNKTLAATSFSMSQSRFAVTYNGLTVNWIGLVGLEGFGRGDQVSSMERNVSPSSAYGRASSSETSPARTKSASA